MKEFTKKDLKKGDIITLRLNLATVTTHNELILNTNKVYLKEVVYERKEILDEEEKKYLRAVIKPFRSRIKNISKIDWVEDREYISFDMKGECGFTLATFKEGTMYKGMKLNKKYSLEELGL